MLYKLNAAEIETSTRVEAKTPSDFGLKEEHIENFLKSRLSEIVSEAQLNNRTVACVENVFDLIEQEDDFSAEQKGLRSIKRPQTRLVSENFRSQGSNRMRPNLPSSKSMDLLTFFVRSVH